MTLKKQTRQDLKPVGFIEKLSNDQIDTLSNS